ncbi:hypothetical protein AB6A40_001682 [Gnathostoma spinigerum]|uniref:Uncharacterized protein n=1 Tax=Gnathostoma spinigerum TaxID=75299 RepID=A0ABD6E4W1_9BILA
MFRVLPAYRTRSSTQNPTLNDEENCTTGVQWILYIFDDCVDTNLKLAGFLIGCVSLILWLVPLIPQMYQNYKRKKCEGLSLFFLMFWFAGDFCNMFGAFLTNQQPIQKVIAIYYICQDCSLLSQFMYYSYYYRPDRRRRSGQAAGSLIVPVLLLAVFGISSFSETQSAYATSDEIELRPFSRHLSSYEEFGDAKGESIFRGKKDIMGYVIGIMGAISYFCGRIPQLIQNIRRRSCEGLSLLMFYIIVSANATYGISVLLGSTGWIYLIRHAPWLAGSLGCCFVDMFVIGQVFYYERLNRELLADKQSLLGSENSDEENGELP